MLRKLNSASKAGFTLVEIMIVVAIIALLAAIAVPNFMRARKRSQATVTLEEFRLLDAAKDQYAIETNKKGSDDVSWGDVKPFLKVTSGLVTRNEATAATSTTPLDAMGNTIVLGTVDVAPVVHADTRAEFGDIAPVDFWGAFASENAVTAEEAGGTEAP